MSRPMTPEERAAKLVFAGPVAPGGLWAVQLAGMPGHEVVLNPHPNPSVVQEEAERVRRFIAAVIRESEQSPPPTPAAQPRSPGGSPGAP